MSLAQKTLASSTLTAVFILLLFATASGQEPLSPCVDGSTPCGASAADLLLDKIYSQVFTEETVGVSGVSEAGDNFGFALAAGDFNADGISDLAIGAPYEFSTFPEGVDNSGAFHVLFGSRDRIVTQPPVYFAESGDNFSLLGYSLAAGDFDGDGRDELAVGLPDHPVQIGAETYEEAGEVWVFAIADDGNTSHVKLRQGEATEGPDSASESFDSFGTTLAVGDFDNDGLDDLAVGSPYDGIGGEGSAGSVNIFSGSESGLIRKGTTTFFSVASPAIPGNPQASGHFGEGMAAGDFNGDGYDDLAIGAWGTNAGSSLTAAGALFLLKGSEGGITDVGATMISQATEGILSNPELLDFFGRALVAADFNGDGFDDLGVGAPSEDEGTEYVDTGVVHILYGSGAGVTGAGSTYLSQGQDGFPDQREASDAFGTDLGAGDFNGDGIADLVIGAREESITFAQAGVIFVAPGSSSGVVGAEARLYAQDTLSGEMRELGDHFGSAFATGDYNGDGFDDLAVGTPGESVGSNVAAGTATVTYALVERLNLPMIER